MKFKDQIQGDIGILSLKGNLMGLPETDKLYDEVRSLLGSGAKKIVIDMHGVNWLNSMGVGALMRAYTTVLNNKGELCLARLTDKARSLFVITQLVKVFKIHDKVEAAVESFQG
jgi:anti-sigma B factor antagonist